jgi:isopentenyl diphosphate isomerase/L-lactate dehydrogenase-like FMN-dependent dehydrogenase
MPIPVNLNEYEAIARERLSPMVYDYFAGGANDEVTLTENMRSWQRMRLRPRVLVDVSRIDTTTTVLGHTITMPVLTAPCSFNAMAHPEGECAVARATSAAGIVQIVSMTATKSIEEIAATVQGPRWFQLICFRDREITRDLVRRAEAANCSALCLTVDQPLQGRRERDIRNRFHVPSGVTMKNLEPYAADKLSADDSSALARFVDDMFDARSTWEVVTWLRSITHLPILIKGILASGDAGLALEHGAAGVIVSNHGGRQLDGVVSTCEALPAVVDAIGGRGEVLVDAGIRRGTDVLKALALGARAVIVGRPYLWGLAVNGEAGVSQVLDMLRQEIILAMGLVGRPTIREIDRTLVV